MCVIRCATYVHVNSYNIILFNMSSFLLNWVNKRPSNSTAIEKPAKKIAVESNEDFKNESLDSDIPTCWNKIQCDNFKTTNNWLIVENKKLGCEICKKIKHLGISAEKNLRISKAWQECSIESNGNTKDSQMSSLRKKIFEHKNSDAHIKATEISQQSKKQQIEK